MSVWPLARNAGLQQGERNVIQIGGGSARQAEHGTDEGRPMSHADRQERTIDAVIFDLDGVVTRTARLHAAAWKRLFDDYLAQRGELFQPFDADEDYRRFVDGKPRYEGVRSFLESRGIALPYGDPGDPPDRESVCGLGNAKNALFQQLLASSGVEVFESSVTFIRALTESGIKVGLVSSSKNTAAVLASVLLSLFLARTIVQPLQRLARGSDRLVDGICTGTRNGAHGLTCRRGENVDCAGRLDVGPADEMGAREGQNGGIKGKGHRQPLDDRDACILLQTGPKHLLKVPFAQHHPLHEGARRQFIRRRPSGCH